MVNDYCQVFIFITLRVRLISFRGRCCCCTFLVIVEMNQQQQQPQMCSNAEVLKFLSLTPCEMTAFCSFFFVYKSCLYITLRILITIEISCHKFTLASKYKKALAHSKDKLLCTEKLKMEIEMSCLRFLWHFHSTCVTYR